MDRPDSSRSLSHYGVKGMKWGVHRDNPSGGSSSRPRVSEDARNAARVTTKAGTHGTQALSNKDLQSAITRLNLENQYHRLTVENRDLLDEGHKQVKRLLNYGSTIEEARKFMKTPTGQFIKKTLFTAATVGAAYATGGTSAAAGAGTSIAVRRASNHYTNGG